MTVQRNYMKAALAATLMGSLLLVACGGDDDNNASSATSSAASSSSVAASSSSVAASSSSVAASSSSVAASSSSVAASSSSVADSSSSSVASTSYPFATGVDSNGWYWFNSTNDAASLSYLVGEALVSGSTTKYSLDSAAAVNSGEFITGYANTLATVTATAYDSALVNTSTSYTTPFTYTGGITIPKATSATSGDGGSLVFKLSSLSAFSAWTATTGSMYYAVDTSTNGTTWTEKYSSGSTAVRAKGESTEDIGAKTGVSTSAIYVRIRNLGTGGLNILGVKIVN